MPRKPPLDEAIIDAAIKLADDGDWPHVRLHGVAAELGVTLRDIHVHYQDLDAVADAWLRRADQAMIGTAEQAQLRDAPAPDRIQAALTAWFGALGGRRKILRAILAYKLQPSHIHLQAALVVATSRRVQWLREAARLNASGSQKTIEEAGLTWLFAASVRRWLWDRSENFERTTAFIARRLKCADRLMDCWDHEPN